MSDSSPKTYKIILMVLPVGVVIGTIIFMFMYFYNERRDEQKFQAIAAHELSVEDLSDVVGKFSKRIGVRDVETEEGRNGLKSASSMIEGRLGPQNVGFTVKKDEGEAKHGKLWKSLWVDIRGKKKPNNVVIAAVSFAGKGEVADANATSTVLMLASAMARDEPSRTIRFVFLPFDQSPAEQNAWLLQRCIAEGEVCDGIIGIQTMKGDLEVGDSEWQLADNSADSQAWWGFLQGGQPRPANAAPSVWVSHSVYAPEAWAGQRDRRLEKTVAITKSIMFWLRQAAE